jgi:SpoVK/Ycf46/Vps4 family AAA+-type ATPase
MTKVKDSFGQELHTRINAGMPGIMVVSHEEQRVFSELLKVCEAVGYNLFNWSCARGLEHSAEPFKNDKDQIRLKAPDKKDYLPDTDNPLDVLKVIANSKTVPPNSIVNLRLFTVFLEDPGIQTYILDILNDFKKTQRQLIITAPVVKLPVELEKHFSVIVCELPSKEILEECLDGIAETDEKIKKSLKPDIKAKVLEAAAGLTLPEAENAFSLALVKGTGTELANIINNEKSQVVKKTGILEIVEYDHNGLKEIGGLDNFKKWVGRRKKAFTPEAKKFGLPSPRGVLLVGPSGSGKSMASKALAAELGIPLIRFDIGKVFGGLVGQSESQMRSALATAEAMAPCVLWIDEIEKSFGGQGGSELDSGTSTRVFASMLTFMNETTKPIFIVATANDVSHLPPELLRKGRFDEIFSVMLPNSEERKEIFRLHLAKLNREHLIGENPKIDLDYFSEKTDGFSGAEIAASIIEGLHISFDDDKELNFIDLERAIDETKPLSVTMGEKLSQIKEWCRDRTRSANAEPVKVKEAKSVSDTTISVASSLLGGGRKIKTQN